MGAERGKPYRGDLITVTFDARRCLHAAECVRGLPQVFDTGRRPWISPDAAPADEVAEVVRRCPSGALQYRLADGTTERPDVPTTVPETRVMLCGCGASGNQPYCDLSGSCKA
ncbi:(4Fe-4S)-binding protein [Streptomyces sp. NPDC059037]|uniref:(4Fe-4S)-binding protein n=1 Tax=Streptomyces sp. NPDC059037 TaxID=3346710 RepID=UPI0036887B5C